MSPSFVEHVDVSQETVEDTDQIAVLTSNILFFVIMFVFAVFETCVLF